MVDTLSVSQYFLASCCVSANVTDSTSGVACSFACCTPQKRKRKKKKRKVEPQIYFRTAVKHSFSWQCPSPKRHYRHDVTHLKSKAFNIFSLWMDSYLPDDLFRILKTQEVGQCVHVHQDGLIRSYVGAVENTRTVLLCRDFTWVALISFESPLDVCDPPSKSWKHQLKLNSGSGLSRPDGS